MRISDWSSDVCSSDLHSCHTADQNHVVDLGNLDAGVLDGDAARLDGTLDQFFDQRFQLGAGNLQVQVLGSRSIRRDIRQVDFSLLCRGKLNLGFFSRFLQALQRQHVFGQVDPAFLLEFADDVVADPLIDVFAAQESITVGGQHFELLLAIYIGDLDDGEVKSTAAQVIEIGRAHV